mmetsp:Transcript_2139/g.5097  ORF Transcript_2139/g.5097 Transcript_2139/m.5097 type:complete len:200 (+) Transcript_2139:1194-1793(+)
MRAHRHTELPPGPQQDLPTAVRKAALRDVEGGLRSGEAGGVRRRLHRQGAVDFVQPEGQLKVQITVPELTQKTHVALRHHPALVVCIQLDDGGIKVCRPQLTVKEAPVGHSNPLLPPNQEAPLLRELLCHLGWDLQMSRNAILVAVQPNRSVAAVLHHRLADPHHAGGDGSVRLSVVQQSARLLQKAAVFGCLSRVRLH